MHRVAADGPQEPELRVDPAQHVAPRVVVAEERVEAVLDDLVRAVGQRVRPARRAARPGRRRLEQRDRHPALGQHHRGADPGDPPADDDGLGASGHAARQHGSATTDAGPHPQGAARLVSSPLSGHCMPVMSTATREHDGEGHRNRTHDHRAGDRRPGQIEEHGVAHHRRSTPTDTAPPQAPTEVSRGSFRSRIAMMTTDTSNQPL